LIILSMARVLVRNLDERVVSRLKKRARQNDRSLQAELEIILERAAAADVADFRSLAARIRQKLAADRRR